MPYLHIFHFTYIWRHIFGGFCWFQISIVQSMQKIISITAHILDIVSLKHRHEFRTVSVSSTLSKLSRKICASVRREIPRTHLIKGRKRFIIQPLRQSLPKGFTKSAASRQALKNPLFNMKMNLVSQTFFMCVLLG